MKCVIIFAVLLAIAFAKPLEYIDSTEAAAGNVEEVVIWTLAPPAYDRVSELESEGTTLPSIGERAGESAPETPAPTGVYEEYLPTTFVPVEADESPALTEVPSIGSRLSENAELETVAPTEAVEEVAPTTSATYIAERFGEESSVAPTAAAEEISAPSPRAPVSSDEIVEIIVIPDSSEAPIQAPAEPSSEAPVLAERVKEEETKPEEPSKPEEPIKPEEPSKPEESEKPKQTRLVTFTFYNRSSKITSLRHFLEYLRSLKKK